MEDLHKRIITVDAAKVSELRAAAFDVIRGSLVRPSRTGVESEYVIEVPNTEGWRKFADRLAEKYDNGK